MSLVLTSLFKEALLDVVHRVRARPDTEFQQALVRLVIVTGFYLYFSISELGHDPRISDQVHLLGTSITLASLILVLGPMFDPKASFLRRSLAMALDFSVATYMLSISGETGAPVVATYLWVTLGYGFRYGMPYLFVSTVLSAAGFFIVYVFNTFWQAHAALWWGIWLTLVVVPIYASSLLKQLHRAVRREKEASQAKSQFLANMSHELRTPLNGVIGIADLLRETSLNKEQQELTQAIHASAQTLQKLIENVLDISKIEAGKLSQNYEDYDLHHLLSSTVLMLEPQAHRKGLLLATHIAPQTPYSLHGDVQHIRQVLINLIGNAIKFTEHGRVDVYVRPFTQRTQSWLRFEVVDSGIGIPVELQGRIFESFTQADASITRRYGGTGLGTTISKRLVEMMGGRIGLVSQPGDGTTFWFEIPAQEQKKAQESLPAKLRIGTLVGLELENRLRDLVRSWESEIIPINAPAGAVLQVLSESNDTPDALIVERTLLGNDPALFVRMLHDSAGLAHLPVILFDSQPGDLQDMEWLKAGYANVLHAPVNPTLLFNALHEAAYYRKLPDNVVSLADHFQARAGRIKLRVLVAEDNPVNQRVMRGLLEHAGHEVVMASNGEEALSLLESKRGQFSMAIMDMHMPVMSGPDTVKRWRFMEEGHLPIIMLTADARGEAEQQCLDAGADGFLTKPVNSRALMDMLARYALQEMAEPARKIVTRKQELSVLDEVVLMDLAEVGGGLDFVRDLIEDFRLDSNRAVLATREALRQENYAVWKDQLHMLKGGASDVGALAMADICATAERIKPYEISLPLATEQLDKVVEAQQAALAALDDFLARQRNALEM
ncbi:MAG: response regulator [Hydrogenophilaceae bacterium]|nr:response regulator [Hydrogenophilaceae bacterium]